MSKLEKLGCDNADTSELQAALKKLENEKEELKKQEKELQHKEKVTGLSCLMDLNRN